MGDDDLSRYLASLEREECYRVDAVLKQSPYETTQRVFFVGANGSESGPFIRKYISCEANMGNAYSRIFEAQQSGRRFKYIPQIIECYSTGESLVVVMEYVQGEPLDRAVERMRGSVDTARAVFPMLCDAVDELHGSFDPPLIHRDLKPSNIMLSYGGATIIDFGIARTFNQVADSDTTHFGTRAFAPPEQFGFGQTTVRSDVYALGLLLYYCLVGSIPTPAMRESGFRNAGIPEPLRLVVARATELDPARRFPGALDLKEAFFAACNAVAIPYPSYAAPNVPPAGPMVEEAQGRPPEKRTPSFITLRNVLVAVLVCFWVAASLIDLFSPPERLAGRSVHFIVLLQGVLMPFLGIALGYLCLDKRALVARFPALASVKWYHVVIGYIVLFVGTAALEALLNMASRGAG